MGAPRGNMGFNSSRLGGSTLGGNRYSGMRTGWYAGRFDGGRFAGDRFRGRTAFYRNGRGYWRGGRWIPFVGLGFYAGGSCYENCLEQGYSPGYCATYAYNFCY